MTYARYSPPVAVHAAVGQRAASGTDLCMRCQAVMHSGLHADRIGLVADQLRPIARWHPRFDDL